jgi:hypothetical protein
MALIPTFVGGHARIDCATSADRSPADSGGAAAIGTGAGAVTSLSVSVTVPATKLTGSTTIRYVPADGKGVLPMKPFPSMHVGGTTTIASLILTMLTLRSHPTICPDVLLISTCKREARILAWYQGNRQW